MWATFPQVGFMLTAAIPAMSGATGLQWAFGAIHNTMAPLAMLAIVTFETVSSRSASAPSRASSARRRRRRIETELSHREAAHSARAHAKLRVLAARRVGVGLPFVSLQVTGRHCHRHSHHHLHHHHLHLTSSTIPRQGYLAFCVNHSYVIALLRLGGRRHHPRIPPPRSPASTTCAARASDVAGRIEREKLIKPEDDTSSSDGSLRRGSTRTARR